MSRAQKMTTDLVLAVQIVGVFVLGGSQFIRLLETIEGVNVMMFIAFEVFIVLNLAITIGLHRKQATRVTYQLLATYLLWFVAMGMNVGAVLWRGDYQWGKNDLLTGAMAGSGVVATMAIAYHKGLGITDPIIKGWLAFCFKAVPQVMLGVKIMAEGGRGLPAAAVWMGHITIIARLCQIGIAVREGGWNRSTKGLAISEATNELSWVIVTIIWLYK